MGFAKTSDKTEKHTVRTVIMKKKQKIKMFLIIFTVDNLQSLMLYYAIYKGRYPYN